MQGSGAFSFNNIPGKTLSFRNAFIRNLCLASYEWMLNSPDFVGISTTRRLKMPKYQMQEHRVLT